MKVKFAKTPPDLVLPSINPQNEMTLDATATAFNSRRTVLSFDQFQTTSGGPLPATIHLLWEQAVELEVRVKLKYDLLYFRKGTGLPVPGKGNYDLAQVWRISYSDDGIQLHTGNMQDFGAPSGTGLFVVGVQLGADQSPNAADSTFVTLMVRLVGGLSTDGVTLGYGPISATVGQSSSSVTMDIPLRVECHAKGKPKKPEKRETLALPSGQLNYVATFEKENQPDLSATQLDRLTDHWYQPLAEKSPELAYAIQTGLCPVKLTGHASTTGSRDYNLVLSTKRISSVMAAIRDNFPKEKQRIVFLPVPKGKDAATQKGPVVREHRVEIEIDPHMAAAAIRAHRAIVMAAASESVQAMPRP